MMGLWVFSLGAYMLYLLSFGIGFFVCILLFSYSINSILNDTFHKMETQILLAALSLIQYKYHAIKILEIAYDASSKKYPSKNEEYNLVVAKIHEKFDSYGESWIKLLMSRLPYKTQYNDWKSALAFAEQLLTNNKQK